MIKTCITNSELHRIQSIVVLVNINDNAIMRKLDELHIARDLPGNVNNIHPEYKKHEAALDVLRAKIHVHAVALALQIPASLTSDATEPSQSARRPASKSTPSIRTEYEQTEIENIMETIKWIHSHDREIIDTMNQRENTCDLVGDITKPTEYRILSRDLENLRVSMHELACDLVKQLHGTGI